MQASSEDDVVDPLTIMPVEHASEYVIGFPMYLAVTVRARPNIELNRLVFGNPVNLRACLGVDAQGPGKTIRTRPRPIIESSFGRAAQSLVSGESRRMLLDVSPLFHTVGEGEYSAQFQYAAPEVGAVAPPLQLHFRQPTREDQAILQKLAPDRADFNTWGEWCLTPPKQPVDPGALNQAGPLTFSLALRYLLFGKEPLSSIDPAILDVLQGVYAPERDLMKAELYQERGDDAAALKLQEAVHENTVGLDWWIALLHQKSGFVRGLSRRPKQDQ